MIIFGIGIVALASVLTITPGVRSLALRLRIGDPPGERKVHSRFIPRLGGVGIILAFAAGVAVAVLFEPSAFHTHDLRFDLIIVGTLLVIGLGLYDDIYGIGSTGKLALQGIASVFVVYSGLRLQYLTLPFLGPLDLSLLGLPLTFLWLVGVTNAVNLLDGLDGLACGVSAIVAATFFSIAWLANDSMLMFISASLLFACVGFLRFNFHPASIFMGDTGSLFLGFVLASVSLYVLRKPESGMTPLSLLIVVVTLAVPIVDTSVAFFRRLRRGMHPLKPDKEHIHHRLMDLGLTHRQTVVTIYAISVFNGIDAFLLVLVESLYSTLLLVVVFVAIFLGIRRLGYLEELRAKHPEGRPPIQPLSVARLFEKTVLVFGDLAALLGAFFFSHWFRFQSGLFAFGAFVPFEAYIVNPALLMLVLFWFVLFAIAGLYEVPWDLSRIDYGLLVLKTTAFGTMLIFLATLDFSSATFEGRLTTLIYGTAVAFCVILVRMFIVSFERRHEILGFRKRNTLLVGKTPIAAELIREILERPSLRYQLVGIVDRDDKDQDFMGFPVLGRLESIPMLVKKYNVEEILIATGSDAREEILDIIAHCDGVVPAVKLAPESINLLSGFKTEEIIGHPLIRLYPTNLKTWQRMAKRALDLIVATLVLLPLFPLWVLIALAIKLDSPGPFLFAQERVGQHGKLFKLYKFRSMVHDAEKETGPIWASADDKRVTRIGRILRRLRIDEVPQFFNVLKGEMSLVGPRPERPFFVEQLKKEVPFYMRRLLVRPGITGWAQVKHRYDSSLDDVKRKIMYDLYYLENMSLILDLKIILRTVMVAISGKATN